jgi:RNA polymerase sigma factor (sigma-70 family)
LQRRWRRSIRAALPGPALSSVASVKATRCNACGCACHLMSVDSVSMRAARPLDSPQPPARRAHAVGEFEALYRAHVGPVTSFFARRAREPQTVGDLTADTFVEAISSFQSAPPRPGAERAWVFTIARRVYAKHCEQGARRDHAAMRAAVAGRELSDAAVEDLLERIDAEHLGGQLLEGLAGLSPVEREALELVDLVGLTPREAAQMLELPAGTLRVRLFRARVRLRKEQSDVQIRG